MSDPSEIVQLARSMLSAYDEDNHKWSHYRERLRESLASYPSGPSEKPLPDADPAKKRRFSIRPVGERAWCVCDSLSDALESAGVANADDGDGFEIEVTLKTDAEVEAMGEFGGW